MSDLRLEATLRELRVPDYVEQAGQATLARAIAAAPSDATGQADVERLPRLGFLYETQGLAAFQNWTLKREDSDRHDASDGFDKAFTCWQALSTLPGGLAGQNTDRIPSPAGLDLIRSELTEQPLPPELALAFRLGVAGTLSRRTAEARLVLCQITLPETATPDDWQECVALHVFAAVTRLIRKANGWEDIDRALASIQQLRELQQLYEAAYVDRQGESPQEVLAAVGLLGLYHLAQLVTTVGEYLRDGETPIARVNIRIDRHHEQAVAALLTGRQAVLAHLADLLWAGCRELAQNAIWTHVINLGERARQYAQLLAARGRPQPVIELWPSQQAALRRNLLDPYQRAILVEMPTSAGKTLLAKFAIVQTKALNPNATIAYIVPTRALVNQVTHDLRDDFRDLHPLIRVEQAVPAFELDPTEDRLLGSAPDVLVTTPEKLDLLIRRDHAATRDIALVVADEAHNIREQGRGPRLELLLGMIKRDRAGARFLLLSPFLPNARELVTWLGDDRALDPICVDWKPGRRLVGAVRRVGRGTNRKLEFETLPAADNADIREGLRIPIGVGSAAAGDNTISDLTRGTVQAMLARGSVLVLCRGQGTAVARAKEIAEESPLLPADPNRDAVCRYLEAEVGRTTGLVDWIQRGVAYHHAGLSHEARWLIEGLIRRGAVQVVCGTTTLAQGVNFPITTVVVETLKKGDTDLSYQDFWNIAGRAGRTLIDSLGVVAFPAPSPQKRQEYLQFLQQEAQEISSQLATLIDRADEIAERFSLYTLRRWPELSALLQFLAHALRVSKSDRVADEVEDLLRASLVYHQAQRLSPNAVAQLVQLCRSYLQQIQAHPSILALADQTGFATPSVLSMLSQKSASQELSSLMNWHPDRLFGDDLRPLRRRVEAIAELPEMQLGQGTRPPFNAERVAAILRDWVRGDNLDELALRYAEPPQEDPDKRVSAFSRYLFSELLGRASWGIGALEGVCLAGTQAAEWEEVGYVPSMIFFGVQRREAVWLRMVGVPRVVADGLANLWSQHAVGAPQTYDEIRRWVGELSDENWRQAIPPGASLSPEDMRLIWREFAG